jgi:hypothetical protein
MFDNDHDGERQRAYLAKRRVAAEDRYLDKLDRLSNAAEPLIGQLMREGRTIFYVNIRSKVGALTGRTREFGTQVAASDYLIRNHYV